MVFAAEGDDLESRRGVEGGIEGVLAQLVHGHLRVAASQGCTGGKASCVGERVVCQSLGWGDEIHQTDAFRLGCGDPVAGHEKVLGAGRAHEERPDGGAPIACDDSDPHVRVGKEGAFRGKDDVAEQGERRAQADGRPFHGGDDGNLDFEEVPDHLFPVPAHRLQNLGLLEFREPVEVAAGREDAAVAGEQDRTRFVLPLERAEEVGEFLVQHGIDGIQLVSGVRNLDAQDVAVALGADRLEVVDRGHAGIVPSGFDLREGPGVGLMKSMNSWDLALWAVALGTLVGVPAYARLVRGRQYSIFGLIILAVSLPGALALHARLDALLPALAPWVSALFLFGMLATAGHLTALVRPRLRATPFRLMVSIPGMAFVALGALAGVWLVALLPVRGVLALAGADGLAQTLRWLDLVPVVVVVLSVVTSMRLVEEVVSFSLADDGPEEFARLPVRRYRRRVPEPTPGRPLRIVQVTDPHLGPWQPVHKLRRSIERLIAMEPDLVLLTGDFLTMEGMGSPGALGRALAPLRALPGRCFAVFGNHDHESPDEVRDGLRSAGIQLLLDSEAFVDTAAGPVQIVGADYRRQERREHLQSVLERNPRRAGHVRLLLLHDPSAFKHVPKGQVDLTLSGHTHGGQLGTVSFGFDWTVLKRTAWPDHGLFAHGANRLYVHRGTGFYGFPLRIGVPGEASRLDVSIAKS